jgi:hypothetical protein
MVKWATYYVQPSYFKMGQPFTRTKKVGKLDAKLWITSSDNFASWGGGDPNIMFQI